MVFYLGTFSRDMIYIYDETWKEQKNLVLTKCESLNELSCPMNTEANPTDISSLAIKWRQHCRHIINESNIYELSRHSEELAMQQAMRRVLSNYPQWTTKPLLLSSSSHQLCESDRFSSWMNPFCHVYFVLQHHLFFSCLVYILVLIIIQSAGLLFTGFLHRIWMEHPSHNHNNNNNSMKSSTTRLMENDHLFPSFDSSIQQNNNNNNNNNNDPLSTSTAYTLSSATATAANHSNNTLTKRHPIQFISNKAY